ncbi:hypothetical protein ACFQVA_18330 [Actinomadura keratinilytica]
MPLRCALLNDYQGVATTSADWSPVLDRVELTAFPDHVGTEDELAAALADFDIVVTLRERVPFPASLFARLPACACWSPPACATPRSTSRRPAPTASPSAAPPATPLPRSN